MFGGREVARFETDRSGADLDEWIEEGLSPLGDVEVRDNGKIRIRPTASLGNSWAEVRIDGRVRERRDGEIEVEITYDMTVGPGTWVLGLIFLIIGLFILISLNQSQTQIGRRIRDVLADMEDDADDGR